MIQTMRFLYPSNYVKILRKAVVFQGGMYDKALGQYVMGSILEMSNGTEGAHPVYGNPGYIIKKFGPFLARITDNKSSKFAISMNSGVWNFNSIAKDDPNEAHSLVDVLSHENKDIDTTIPDISLFDLNRFSHRIFFTDDSLKCFGQIVRQVYDAYHKYLTWGEVAYLSTLIVASFLMMDLNGANTLDITYSQNTYMDKTMSDMELSIVPDDAVEDDIHNFNVTEVDGIPVEHIYVDYLAPKEEQDVKVGRVVAALKGNEKIVRKNMRQDGGKVTRIDLLVEK